MYVFAATRKCAGSRAKSAAAGATRRNEVLMLRSAYAPSARLSLRRHRLDVGPELYRRLLGRALRTQCCSPAWYA